MLCGLRASQTFRWVPMVPSRTLTAARCASSLRKLDSDLGQPLPKSRPEGKPVYMVEPASKTGSFRRYIQAVKPERWWVAGAIAGVGIYSAAVLGIPAGFGTLIDQATKGSIPFGTSYQLLALFGLEAVANVIRLYCIGVAGERLITRLRGRLFSALMKQPSVFFDSPGNRTGALVQRLTMDCNVMGSSLTEAVTQGTKSLCQTVGAIGVMMYFSPTLTGVIVALLPPTVIFAAIYGRYVRRLQATMQDAIADAGVVAEERLGNIKMVRAFGREKEEQSWYQAKIDKVMKLSLKMHGANSVYVGSLHMVGYVTLYCMVWAGSLLVAADNLSAGHLFSFFLYTMYCGMGMTGLTNIVTDINKGYGASLRVFEIIDAAEKIEESAKSQKALIPEKPQFDIAFKDVHFAYPTRPEVPIFQGLSVDISPGRCTCVVGASGSGKSSMGALLTKLYDANGGNVTLDGVPISDIDNAWLRSKIGLVQQEPVLFGGSILQNIAYGIPDRDWDEPLDQWLVQAIHEVAAKANAHDFILALPEGYDTYVGEGGRSLSGGQKQRIAIARALLRDPQLLILDEATSALDSESEVVVAAAIEKLIDDARQQSRRTVLMFAHKLSMIRKADLIVVLHEGRVVDQGDFETVSMNPLFRQLVGLDGSSKSATSTPKIGPDAA